MSESERYDDLTQQLVTGLDEIHVPQAVLRTPTRRRGVPVFAVATTALVLVGALALGTALRRTDNGAAAPGIAASATPAPTATRTPTPTDIRAARSLPEAEAKRLVESTALAVVDALQRKDAAKLASLAHPAKGVRFSVYPYVRTDTDQVLTAADLATAFSDPKVRLWGITDGKGDDIRLTYAKYQAQYVYDVDFSKAPEVAYNRAIGKGNSTDNSATAYPDAVMVEFHYPGFDPKFSGMDWRSLRLFFEQKDGTWYLVGIVHGQWTI
ncbi:MAG TPA: hypothetical protein VGS17_12475 [Candidatus Limnocylindria bacterium]|nr:hypothetical protein [Candidatus Limnocylindria bacterium]